MMALGSAAQSTPLKYFSETKCETGTTRQNISPIFAVNARKSLLNLVQWHLFRFHGFDQRNWRQFVK